MSLSNIALPSYPMWIQEPYFHSLRPDVVTPHTKWARPYAGRSLKLLVIAPRWTQRSTLELQQRFDFDAVPVMTEFSHVWGDTKAPHYTWAPYGTAELHTEQALAELRGHCRPDVIVIGHMDCTVIPQEVESAIIDALDAGVGLVILNPLKLSGKLRERFDNAPAATSEAVAGIVNGCPIHALPPLYSRGLADGGLLFRDADGRGRIVVADYTERLKSTCVLDLDSDGVDWTAPDINGNCYLEPGGTYRDESVRDIHYDYFCALSGRCILWAARALPSARLTGWHEISRRAATNSGDATLGELACSSGASAHLTIRNLDATVMLERRIDTAADDKLRLTVPQLPTGDYFIDVILNDDDNRVLDWGSHCFFNDSGAQITEIVTERKSYELDKPVPVTIALSGDQADSELQAELFDTTGRLLWQKIFPADAQVSFDADVRESLSIQCELRIALKRDDRVLALESHHILVRQPLPDVNRFTYGAWAAVNHSMVRRQAARIFAEQGVTTGILGGDMDEWAALNVRPSPYATRYYPENAEDEREGLMVRRPCLTDPDFLEQETGMLRQQAEKYRHYSPTAYSLGDDQAMMLTYQDGCVSPTCLVAFRRFLAAQYGSVDALNESWGSAYDSFDEAMPIPFAEARQTGRYAAWADHRLYMDDLFVRMHSEAKKVIREIDTDAMVGFEGPILDDSWYGYAWRELLNDMDLMVVYPNTWKFDIIRSFKKPGLLFGGWYGGYAMYRNPDDTRFYPWFLLFNGCNSYWFFSHYGWAGAGHPASGIGPDLRVTPCLRDTTTAVQKIQSGLDRLILQATRETDDVLIYFSRPSHHAATLMPDIPTRDYNTNAEWQHCLAAPALKWSLNTEAMLRLLDDIGISYTFIDRTEIEAGALEARQPKLLVMPQVHAISAIEADAIVAYSEAGGAVLADYRPAVFDEHSRPLGRGRLDDIFGVANAAPMHPLSDQLIMAAAEVGNFAQAAASGAMMPEDTPDRDEAPAASTANGYPMPVDPSVSLAGATADYVTEDGVPVFIRHGRSFLMNMAVQHYLTLRAAGRGGGLRESVREWFCAIDIRPDTRIEAAGDHSAQVRVFRFRDGKTRIVGLLRPHKRLLDEAEAFVDREPRPFALRFAEGHVYDCVNHEYLGECDRLDLEIEAATPYLFAVLPYQVVAIDVNVQQAERTVRVDTVVQTSGGDPARHILHVRVTDADGKLRREYEGVVIASDGHEFTLALNDPDGEWAVAVTDAATGVRTDFNFALFVPSCG